MELDLSGGGTMPVEERVFGSDYNEPLVHQAVVAFLAGARSGTSAQKTRATKSGSGIKPWRQKGTGRARAGSRRSPLWRGGGRAFATRPRSHQQKVNRKMYRGAMRALLSELNRRRCLHIVDEFMLSEPKTRLLVEKLRELPFESTLIVLAEFNENILLASNNLPWVGVLTADRIDPVNLLRFEGVLLTRAAVGKIQEWLA